MHILAQALVQVLVLVGGLVWTGLAIPAFAQDGICTFQTYAWNVQTKSAVKRRTVQKNYSELTIEERDERTGCSVCREDQRAVTLRNGLTFQLCGLLADRTEDVLNAMVLRGETVISVTGYRVGLTRGPLDAEGNRTGYSNHSFGIALDVNAEFNGLYGNCIEFGPACQLRKGGRWQPRHKGGLHPNSPTVKTLKQIGFKWGGEIKGRQKDFMHFSPSGY